MPKEWIWDCLGLHIWAGVGALWGLFWSLLGASWSFRGRSKSSFCKALIQNGLQEGFWSILGRFGEGFGKISGGFRKVVGGFGPNLGWILDELGGKSGGALTNLKKAGAESLNRTPALLREASQCAGVLGDPPA